MFYFLEHSAKQIKTPLRNIFTVPYLGVGYVSAVIKIYLHEYLIDQLIEPFLQSLFSLYRFLINIVISHTSIRFHAYFWTLFGEVFVLFRVLSFLVGGMFVFMVGWSQRNGFVFIRLIISVNHCYYSLISLNNIKQYDSKSSGMIDR